jgi:hypothetical protein
MCLKQRKRVIVRSSWPPRRFRHREWARPRSTPSGWKRPARKRSSPFSRCPALCFRWNQGDARAWAKTWPRKSRNRLRFCLLVTWGLDIEFYRPGSSWRCSRLMTRHTRLAERHKPKAVSVRLSVEVSIRYGHGSRLFTPYPNARWYVGRTNGTYIFVKCLVISRLISFRGLVRRS